MVVLEISLQHPGVTFASNRVISIKLVHGNQGKIRVAFVISVIPLISVLSKRRLRRNVRRVLWHPLLFVLKLLVSCRNLSGKLHLQSGTVNGVRCSVRDTAATVCGVRKRLVRPCQLLGSSIRCLFWWS